MEVTIEQLLQFLGEAAVKLRLMEQELIRLQRENEEFKKGGVIPPPLNTDG